jgi:hypothetical protein
MAEDNPIRIIKHEAVPDCGSFEVRLPDRTRKFWYWDDIAGRRLRPDSLTQEQAKAFARAARDALG